MAGIKLSTQCKQMQSMVLRPNKQLKSLVSHSHIHHFKQDTPHFCPNHTTEYLHFSLRMTFVGSKGLLSLLKQRRTCFCSSQTKQKSVCVPAWKQEQFHSRPCLTSVMLRSTKMQSRKVSASSEVRTAMLMLTHSFVFFTAQVVSQWRCVCQTLQCRVDKARVCRIIQAWAYTAYTGPLQFQPLRWV